MQYISTRGHAAKQSFCDILLEGLAPDGGLYLPVSYPRMDSQDLTHLRSVFATKGYPFLAFEILSRYIDDIPPADLLALCQNTYRSDVFGSNLIAPVRTYTDQIKILGLSNGPTLAFKDMAMQLLGHLFEYELNRRSAELNILGATSGDTGSAAEHAMRGKKGVRVFMTSPYGRMSRFQQAQMFSLQDANIFNIAIEGVFDDCQDIVKAVSSDLTFKKLYKIGTVNSINWARLLAQVVYYFAGYFQATKGNHQQVSFAVPSGNFGNVCAGHVARMMGLPISKLVVATNENDVLDEFFKTGSYQVRDTLHTFETSSPSMDISKASNFERFIFDLLARNADQTSQLFGDDLVKSGQFSLAESNAFAKIQSQYGFYSGKSSHQNRIETIQYAYARHDQLLDPHTADGLKVAQDFLEPHVPMLVLETALPIKFASTIEEALGFSPPVPPQFSNLEKLPQRVETMPASVSQVKSFIEAHCKP